MVTAIIAITIVMMIIIVLAIIRQHRSCGRNSIASGNPRIVALVDCHNCA